MTTKTHAPSTPLTPMTGEAAARIQSHTAKAKTADGVPTFTMNTVQTGGQIILTTTAFRDVTATTPTWSMQIGLRYMFN